MRIKLLTPGRGAFALALAMALQPYSVSSQNPCMPLPAPSEASTASSTPQASANEDYWSLDGVLRWVAPNTYGQWVQPPSQTNTPHSAWLTPTGGSIGATPAQLKTLQHLAPGGPQNVETMHKLLGNPTRVDYDQGTQMPAIAYWDIPSSGIVVIGVVGEENPKRFIAVRVN